MRQLDTVGTSGLTTVDLRFKTAAVEVGPQHYVRKAQLPNQLSVQQIRRYQPSDE